MGRTGFSALLDGLFGETCPSCFGRTAAGFCAGCAAELPRIAGACRACGLAHSAGTCPALAAEWRVARVLAPFSYAAPLDRFVRALKYHGARELGRAFGLLLAAEAHREPPAAEALVPVPLHPHRLRERGYNQATEIARTLGEELAVPVLVGGVHRLREAVQQAGQSAGRRRANVAAAFAARRDLRGRAIAIIDDVITTGATVNALAAALLAAGAGSCEAWAIARTPPHHSSTGARTPTGEARPAAPGYSNAAAT
ncbi:MAG TPA: ComF family protein [Gammaproteobacteria bacterium]|nr:ComF family protein [Gammaproteobacteria bacterium]